jgi:DNA primase
MEIQDLKTRFTILDIADRLQITVDKQGKALCPFHDDKTPSLQFSKEKNICTCFSSKCDAGSMDIIGLTEKKLMLNTHEAIMQLKEWANHQPTNGKPKAHLNGKSVDPPYPKLFQVFQSNLPKSTKAKAYLKSRGLTADLPEVGYNATSWPQMKECIIFPLKDKSNGEITGLYGRSTIADGHFYNKGRKGLYPGYPAPTTTSLILTESIIDAATLAAVAMAKEGQQAYDRIWPATAPTVLPQSTGKPSKTCRNWKRQPSFLMVTKPEKKGQEKPQNYCTN